LLADFVGSLQPQHTLSSAIAFLQTAAACTMTTATPAATCNISFSVAAISASAFGNFTLGFIAFVFCGFHRNCLMQIQIIFAHVMATKYSTGKTLQFILSWNTYKY
jgi:hypothetical protein